MKASVIKIDPVNPDKIKISSAAKVIRAGGLVVFPTETVYGIAANLSDDKAMARLCKLKERPREKPFTVHISDEKMIRDMGCSVTDAARKLMDRFWPGPLTIILNSRHGKKVGFRMPSNKIAFNIIESSGVPVVAPSANLSGRIPPNTASEAMIDMLESVDMVIDGGPTEMGAESTVVDMTEDPPRILRAGIIRKSELLEAING
ncbi:MAG: L-threonylcarbamoyladenylate synthase [Candidatus Omnitrophota bacterium]